jgi:hypothetical protein
VVNKDIESKRGFWQEHFRRQEGSGLSQRAYCRREGLSISQFCYWHRKAQTGDSPQSSRLVEVPVRLTGASQGSVEIVVDGRYTVRVGAEVGEQQLVRVVRALDSLR